MRRSIMRSKIFVGSMALIAVIASSPLVMAGANQSTDWPFGDSPRDAFNVVPHGDLVVTIGSTAWTPGSAVRANMGMAFRADPFFTRSMTDLAILPELSAQQVLATGLRFDWWSASVNVDLSLAPWGLTSAGGWLEIHPPEWMVLENPAVALGLSLGWGPQWVPVGAWTHKLAAHLDAQAAWTLPTFWDTPLDLIMQSDLSGAWNFPSGDFAPQWQITLDVRSRLPLFADTSTALRAGVAAGVSLFPTFGFGFDMQLELRANAFYAYGLVGAGAAGIRAELGVELSFGLNLFGGLLQDAQP